MEIVNVLKMPIRDIQVAGWGMSACYLVKPDYKKLKASIERYGILSPVVLNSDNSIIDGHQRIEIASELGLDWVPVTFVNVDRDEAIILHIDLNRYRGVIIAKFLSNLIQLILREGNYEMEELRERLGMSEDEFYILAEGSLVKMRKIKQHSYSPAWVPIESSFSEDIHLQGVTGHAEQV